MNLNQSAEVNVTVNTKNANAVVNAEVNGLTCFLYLTHHLCSCCYVGFWYLAAFFSFSRFYMKCSSILSVTGV